MLLAVGNIREPDLHFPFVDILQRYTVEVNLRLFTFPPIRFSLRLFGTKTEWA